MPAAEAAEAAEVAVAVAAVPPRRCWFGGSNTVPQPHSTALLTPAQNTVTNMSGADAAAPTTANR